MNEGIASIPKNQAFLLMQEKAWALNQLHQKILIQHDLNVETFL